PSVETFLIFAGPKSSSTGEAKSHVDGGLTGKRSAARFSSYPAIFLLERNTNVTTVNLSARASIGQQLGVCKGHKATRKITAPVILSPFHLGALSLFCPDGFRALSPDRSAGLDSGSCRVVARVQFCPCYSRAASDGHGPVASPASLPAGNAPHRHHVRRNRL